MVAEMTAGAGTLPGAPRELFSGPYGAYDAASNTPSFVMVKEMAAGDPPLRVNLVMNWFQELTRLGAPPTTTPAEPSKR